MGLFKSKEQKEAEKKEEEGYRQSFSEIIIFFGTRDDYERWVGGPVEVVDIAPKSRVKGVYFKSYYDPNDPNFDVKIDKSVRNALVDGNIEAIVVSSFAKGSPHSFFDYIGLPVKKISGSPHRK